MLDPRMLGKELLNGYLLHFPLLFSVDLVAHQDEGELLRLLRRSLVQELTNPRLDVVEGLGPGIGTRLLVIS